MKWLGTHILWVLGLVQVVLACAAGATDLFGASTMKIILFSGGVITAIVGFIKANPPDTITTVAKCVPLLLAMTAILGGCKTLPTPNEQAGIAVAVDIAAGFAIQQHDTNPIIWKGRAQAYKAIALQLQAINSAGPASLATLASDLQPMIAKLGPADVLAANALIAALTPYLQQQVQANPTVANTQAAVGAILTNVINACTAYGA